MIAFSSLMFSRNSAFQMAVCLLVLIFAFILQVRYQPYMPAQEFKPTLKYVAATSSTSPLYRYLKSRVLAVDALARKSGKVNSLLGSIAKAKPIRSYIVELLINYNTVESVLLCSAVMVCLMGSMYIAVSPSDSYYASTRDGITVFLLIIIPLSVAYYVAALLVDLSLQFTSRREKEAKARIKSRGRSKNVAEHSRSKEGADILRDDAPVENSSDTGLNPMFLNTDVTFGNEIVGALTEQVFPPDQMLWLVYRSQYVNTMKALKENARKYAELRQRLQRMRQ
ncbi:MAG: hypothetical protein EOO65_03700 [Methanosarcinales archaeon]|nr:MAG: hypothetical protein EOO65_03700 [Methanosarcinales archaeon]